MTQLKRDLGLFSCTLLVAGNMIGIGIFVTAGRIYALLPNPSYIFLAWLIGGFLSVCGGLVYAELATRFPRAGGGYIFLSKSLGPMWGFLAGFAASMVTVPGTVAFLAIGVTKYLGILDPSIAKIVGISVILGISWINYRGVLQGAWLQDGFMILKLALIFGLVFVGFLSSNGSLEHFFMTAPLQLSLMAALPLALVPIMYTYSGWDTTAFIAGEVKDPRRTLPFSMLFGTLLVAAVYISLVALYLYAIPVTSSIGKERIVTAVASVLFGTVVGKVVGSLVAVSVLGCLTASILVGPRVIYAMAKDGFLPKFAAQVHPRFFTPGKAIVLHAVLACLLLISGTFEQLLDYVTVPSVLFAALNGVGLFFVRARNQSDEGASVYKSFGYPVLPTLFVMGMLWIVGNTILKDPTNSLWGLGMVAFGIPLYVIWKKKGSL